MFYVRHSTFTCDYRLPSIICYNDENKWELFTTVYSSTIDHRYRYFRYFVFRQPFQNEMKWNCRIDYYDYEWSVFFEGTFSLFEFGIFLEIEFQIKWTGYGDVELATAHASHKPISYGITNGTDFKRILLFRHLNYLKHVILNVHEPKRVFYEPMRIVFQLTFIATHICHIHIWKRVGS